MSEENKHRDPYLDENHLYDMYEAMKMANERNTKEKFALQKQFNELKNIYNYVNQTNREKEYVIMNQDVELEQLKAQNKILREALENYTDLHHAPKLEEALADADKVGGV